jgi:cell division protein FtsW (lipid II flippase)
MKKGMILLLVFGLTVPVNAEVASSEQPKKDETEAAREVKIRKIATCVIVYGILGLICRNQMKSTMERINYFIMFLGSLALYLS